MSPMMETPLPDISQEEFSKKLAAVEKIAANAEFENAHPTPHHLLFLIRNLKSELRDLSEWAEKRGYQPKGFDHGEFTGS